MIDALFGSKTRVKLLHLFLNNPDKAFYVREITRLVEEQINSVRRELANLLSVGVITSDSVENKLYYRVNQRYLYYVPFRSIFSDDEIQMQPQGQPARTDWTHIVAGMPGIRLAVAAGVLVKGSHSPVDLLLVGEVSTQKIKAAVGYIEKHESRELNYAILSYDEFYYRLSVRDKFITEILSSKHAVIVDTDAILK